MLSTLCISRAQDLNTAVNTQVAHATHNFSVELLKVTKVYPDSNLHYVKRNVKTAPTTAGRGEGGGGAALKIYRGPKWGLKSDYVAYLNLGHSGVLFQCQ
jgi:hypothetical protein